METEKGKTFKYLREKREVSRDAKDRQKQYATIKKAIVDALKERDLTIEELTRKLNIPRHEVVYYLMSLAKYGYVKTGTVDDMDEYYNYTIKK